MRFRLALGLLALISFSQLMAKDSVDSILQELILEAEPIVEALEVYRRENSEYPLEISDLVPDYIAEIPELFYSSGRRSGNTSQEEIDSWEGFQLRFISDRWERRSFFKSILGTRSMDFLVYRPSGYYPERTYEKPKQRIGEWAIIEHFRSYAEDGYKTNPIINDGV